MEDDKKQAEEWMTDFVKKMIRGLYGVNFVESRYFDQYRGAWAKVGLVGDHRKYKVWIDEDDSIFIENFPFTNTEQKELDGWNGSVDQFRQLIKGERFRTKWIEKIFEGEWRV